MSQLADRHIELNAVLRGNTVGALTRIWRALPDHRDASLETWLQSVPALISAARRQQITITSTYLSRALDRPVDGADADAIMAGYRNGTPLETVYKRPFEVVWRSVGAGTPYPAAAEQGLARAAQTAAADVQMAMRDTLTSVGQAEDSIWGYQRVADGGACEFCLLLDGAQFKTDDPMPIHNFCGCGVEPVVYTRGRANRNNLAKFNSSLRKSGTKARRPDAEPAQSVRGNIAPDQEVAVRRAAGEIQDEFGTSETTPSQLTYHQSLKGKRGDYDPKTGAVRVDATKNPVMTYSHEVGHRIDLGMGDGTAYIRGKNGGWVAPWGDEAAAAREELLAAIMRSDAGQGLLKAKKDVHLLWKTPAGRRQNNFRVNYYLRDEELIARAFAQYIGTRPGLREFFDEYFDEYKRSTEWAKGMGEHYNNYTQWEDDDFEAIIPLLKKYMRAAAKAKAENTGLQPGRGTLKK